MSRRLRALDEFLEKVRNVKPLAVKDGQEYVSFEDAALLNSYYADEPRTGLQTRNPDGSLASTGKRVHAMNPDRFFLNRFKKKGKNLHLVSGHTEEGYRCIQEQSSGHLHTKTVPVYIISRDSDGKLVVEKLTTVSDTEFISDFTEKLDNKSMAEILPLITSYAAEITATTMPI